MGKREEDKLAVLLSQFMDEAAIIVSPVESHPIPFWRRLDPARF